MRQPLSILLGLSLALVAGTARAQVNTGGTATIASHSKQVIGYITQWDAWKTTTAGVPAPGAYTHLNIDYSKYTILNFSFFGVAVDGSLHSGDKRNKNIYQAGVNQEPADLFYTDPYSSWDLHILFGELELANYLSADVVKRAKAQGFDVVEGGATWSHPVWGLKGSLPLPLHKESGAPGLLELAHSKGVKVMASIGGWSMCKHFPEMAADAAKRAKFIADCKKLIAIGFDGIDLDWEYPGPFSGMNFTGTQADYANFLTLVKEIRAAIGPDKLVTAAMSADPKKLQGFDWNGLNGVMDYFNFMTYDYNGGWSNVAGHNSPLADYPQSEATAFNYEGLLTGLKQLGVNLSKVSMGMPFYGRGVIVEPPSAVGAKTVKRAETVQPDGPITTCADFTNWPKDVNDGTPNYEFIRQKGLVAGTGWTRGWDAAAQVPYLTKDKFFLSYDDAESLQKKAEFIKANSLAGTIIWTVYGDLEFGGSATAFGTKLKRWSSVKSPLVNAVNEAFATSGGNVAPTVRITSPLDGASATVGSALTILADARDTDGTIAKVEFFDGSTPLGAVTASPFNWNVAGITAGTHSYTAKATDNAGASGVSTAVKVNVLDPANKPPVVSLTAPANGASYPAPASFSVTAAASDPDGAVASVEFFQGATSLGVKTAAPYAVNVANLAAGSYTFTAVAKDDKGASTTSSTVSVTVTTPGNQAPVVAVTAPKDGATYTAPATFTLKATASDPDGTVASVKFYRDGTLLTTDTTSPYSYAVSKLAVGTYTFTAVATDNKGATTTSVPVKVVVGTTANRPPVVSLTSPANGASFDSPASFAVSATASDPDGTVASVEFFQGGTSLGIKTAAPYTVNVSGLAVGSYTFTAVATDNKGAKTTSGAATVTVKTLGSAAAWKEGVAYKLADEVTYDGKTWVCKYAHTSNSAWYPGAAGLWFWEEKK